MIICIDDFKDQKSSTKYIDGSHYFRDKPERIIDEKKFNIKSINGKAGDVFILDSGIWHKAGDPTKNSRWGLVSYYSPWYFKPYYCFNEMFTNEQISLFNDRQLNLMHLTSKPPLSQFERMNTLVSAKKIRSELKSTIKSYS